MNLSSQARIILDQHFARTAMAYAYPVADPKIGYNFTATPTVAQTVMRKIIEQGAGFLSLLSNIPVSEIAGQKVLVGLSARVAKRTNTAGGSERTPQRLLSTSTQDYLLKPTEFDVALGYTDIDSWAKFPNFSELYMAAVREAIQNDILQAGWTGTSAATATNISSYPLLQDLNIGWLQKIRVFNSASQYHIGTVGVPISIGSTGTYKNLDQLVQDAKQTVAIQFRNRGDLVALISNDLAAKAENTYYQVNGNTPTEKALMGGAITKAYGGLPSITPPFLPDKTVLITPLKNLAVYYQDSSVRRLSRDWPSKDEVQEFNSLNMGYVVQEELATSLIENITLV